MEVSDERLRPALEVAFAVAVIGARQRPPVPPPPSLRPFLRFQKLPPAALTPVRRAVEEDETFRSMVAAVATEDVVDRASWLWLHRPDGWEDELGARLQETQVDGTDTGAGRRRSSGRVEAGRLEAAESRTRRLSAELQIARQEVTRSRDAIARAEEEAARASTRADELDRALSRTRSRLERAERERDEAQGALVELQEAARMHPVAQPAVADEGRGTVETAPSPPAVDRTWETDEATAAESAGTPVAGPSPVPAMPATVNGVHGGPVPSVVSAAALDALGEAARAATSLASALAGLTASLSVGSGEIESSTLQPLAPAVVSAPERRARGARVPLRLPRGMVEGSTEADTWLLTEAGAAVVVDGYNVAKLGWPDQVLGEQRERLLRAVDDMACRYHTSVQVVFDGADVGPVRGERRRRVAVRFSPSTISADDVIRKVVADTPSIQPVIVVTNDAAVVRDVRAAGANVVSSEGLLRVARR